MSWPSISDPDTILTIDYDIEGRFQPRDFDDASVLDPSTGKEQQLVVRTSAIQTSPLVDTPMPIRPRNFSLNGKSLSLATGLPSKSMTRIFP
jgi:hypothetical protein